jgi:hypothetical protein
LIDAVRQALRAERQGVLVMTPARRRMSTVHRPGLFKAWGRLHKYLETVSSPLTEHFAIARIRVPNRWHFQQRLIRKVLAHTVGVFLNLRLQRDPLDLDGLIAL